MSTHAGTSPRQLARRARLRYVNDQEPGITRLRHGQGFIYRWQQRKSSLSRQHAERAQLLAIPPAWCDVWICARPDGHLQATGRDDRGRKQYLYHERWQETVNLAKFDRLTEIGRLLPRIRRRVQRDLQSPALTKRKVSALIVRLLDLTGIRIGNGEYLRDNESYGLTTLQDDQISIRGSHIEFKFVGKSSIEHHIVLDDARVARLVKKCRALSGSFVFQFHEDGVQRAVTSADVNAYLAELSESKITAKDFRTWRASAFVASKLALEAIPASERAAKKGLLAILRETAGQLGNTVTVCRKYYVHTGLTEAFLAGRFEHLIHNYKFQRKQSFLANEQLLMHLLERL